MAERPHRCWCGRDARDLCGSPKHVSDGEVCGERVLVLWLPEWDEEPKRHIAACHLPPGHDGPHTVRANYSVIPPGDDEDEDDG